MNDRLPLPDAANLAFVEELYVAFLRNPTAVPAAWRTYFEAVKSESNDQKAVRQKPVHLSTPLVGSERSRPGPAATGTDALAAEPIAEQQDRVTRLVGAYLARGHTAAAIDPLGLPRSPHPELDPAFYGFTETDLGRMFLAHDLEEGGVITLGEILTRLKAAYCGSIGAEFMHIDDLEQRRWLRERLERAAHRVRLKREEQIRILTRLTDAVMFEEFIQQKYPGAKSFSLEGAESLIPLLDITIETAGAQGIEEIVLGMAHRGRLNVLANILGKRPREIFHEFENPADPLHEGRGDVKYHLGHSRDWVTASGRTVHLSLCFNPSHLEFVNPVALGRVRAKRDRVGDGVMALLIHGDASFTGEGVVQEALNLGRLRGYRTGGTLHVVINNQIGFTTGPEETRSAPYATDVAKMRQIPIFHVNGEDPEAVAHVVRVAMDFRRTFRTDVVIDMYCFRRRGHNEGDEPSFTQPLMYQVIDRRRSLRDHYLEHLLKLGEVTREEVDGIAVERRRELERDLSEARSHTYLPHREKPTGIWTGYYGGLGEDEEAVMTGVERTRLIEMIQLLTQVPDGFHPHPKIAQWLERRRDMGSGTRAIDWSTAEALAFATLAADGRRVRLSGQDTVRGTFSQRHGALHDTVDGRVYVPLEQVARGRGRIEIYNSPLSEAGVLGFEYGYSLDCPEGLILWEAQFGDFVNAAQVVIDQFLVSAEEKWRRLSGLVLLLPHGFEGQGPEHSSARLERFLELAVNDNIQVVNPSTPAQYFHVLRRQVLRRWRKPLIVMTPKSLLRHAQAVSTLDDLHQGRFRRILFDRAVTPDMVTRVLLCSGKVYYDLLTMREELRRQDVAILRLEQLYPLNEAELSKALASYPPNTPTIWVQEEPANMGAWRYLFARFGDRIPGAGSLSAVCRPPSASPATGWPALHTVERQHLLKAAFDVH